jgi:hypothetical protein
MRRVGDENGLSCDDSACLFGCGLGCGVLTRLLLLSLPLRFGLLPRFGLLSLSLPLGFGCHKRCVSGCVGLSYGLYARGFSVCACFGFLPSPRLGLASRRSVDPFLILTVALLETLHNRALVIVHLAHATRAAKTWHTVNKFNVGIFVLHW